MNTLSKLLSVRPARNLATAALLATAIFAITGSARAQAACTQSQVLINQVYAHGGLTGATYRNDYVELYNTTSSACNLANYSIQVSAGNANNFPAVFGFPVGSVIPGNGFFLVQFGSGGSAGAAIPTPDFSAVEDLAAAGKVALVAGTTSINGNCAATKSGSVDYVGYGGTNCYLGTAPAAAPTLTQSIRRVYNGFNTSQNGTDFGLVAATPRNTLSPTAGGVTVTGRVMNQGLPVAGARVTMVDFLGNVAASRTNSFGYFNFYEVASGQYYTIGVAAKGLTFDSQFVPVVDNVGDIEFNAVAPRFRLLRK